MLRIFALSALVLSATIGLAGSNSSVSQMHKGHFPEPVPFTTDARLPEKAVALADAGSDADAKAAAPIMREQTVHWSGVTAQECAVPASSQSPPNRPQVKIQVPGVLGADISEYEGKVDWAQMSAKYKFVIMRYAHGSHLDSQFVDYFKSAKQVGVIRGVYVYIDPSKPYPFADQLRSFVKGVKLEKGDLPPIIDLENPCLWVHMSEVNRMKYVMKWVNAFEKVYGVKPIIYLSPSFVERALGGAQNAAALKNYPLWIANYYSTTPMVPLPWTSYFAWQYSENAPIAGVAIPADADVAPGSLADLMQFTLRNDAGGNDNVLSADDLDDQGLTKKP